MKALIDGDVLLYQFGASTDDEGNPLKWPFVQQRLDTKIHSIILGSGAEEDNYEIHVSGNNNFRVKEATIKPYKGNRNQPKPFWHAKVKEYLLSSRKHTVIQLHGMEADDSMSIAQYLGLEGKGPETVICSPDKDLKMVPGWHYRWATNSIEEIKPFYVERLEGIRWFFKQLLMGDNTDNILGLYKLGKVSADKLLNNTETELDMYTIVQKEYEARFGSYWKMFLHENARLLWMLRNEQDDIRDLLNEYEQLRYSNSEL